jgi:hypothetical protein
MPDREPQLLALGMNWKAGVVIAEVVGPWLLTTVA